MVLRWSQCCDSVLHFIQSCRKWNYSARIWRSGSGQFVQYTGSGCELVAPKMPAVNLNNLLEHFGLQNLVPKWTFVWIQENMSRECCFMIEWVWHVTNQLLASKRKSASDGIVCYVLWHTIPNASSWSYEKGFSVAFLQCTKWFCHDPKLIKE